MSDTPPIWPPPPGGFPPMPPLPPAYPVATNATTILVLGIVSIVAGLLCGLGGLIGIAPWIMGSNALRAIDQGQANPLERGTVNGSRICGIVGVGFACVSVLFYVGMLAFEHMTFERHVGGKHFGAY